jgi:N-acetylglucosamine repressor
MLGVKTAALPSSLRRTNQRTVISLLLRLGSASRADLAKAAGISQPTAGKITTELLELGVLQEVGTLVPQGRNLSPKLGRPGQMLRLADRQLRFLVVELGVAETKVSAMPVAVKLEDEWSISFPTPTSPEAWLAGFKKATAMFPVRQMWGVLISVPGVLDEHAGKVLFSPNLHWLESVNLQEMVQQLWEIPALLVQEIRALALGHLTAEPDCEDFFLIDFGQGVGGAVVLDGTLYNHPMPLSGEVGHTPVPGNNRHCGCGAVGCLETLVSERGLLESFAAAEGIDSPTWPALVKHVQSHGLAPWLKDSLDAAGRTIAGAINVMGLPRVIVTGCLTDLPAVVTEHLAQQIRGGAMWARFGQIVCQCAPHRRTAGMVAHGLDRLVLPADSDSGMLLPSRRGMGRSLAMRK